MTIKELQQNMQYSDEILKLIEVQLKNDENSLSQSDLQAAIDAIVHKIMNKSITPRLKELILEKIQEVDNDSRISLTEADAILTDFLIRAMPKDIQDAYNTMSCNKIPF